MPGIKKNCSCKHVVKIPRQIFFFPDLFKLNALVCILNASCFRLSVKVSEISQLAKEVEKTKSEMTDLQQQLDAQKKKNNVSRIASPPPHIT